MLRSLLCKWICLFYKPSWQIAEHFSVTHDRDIFISIVQCIRHMNTLARIIIQKETTKKPHKKSPSAKRIIHFNLVGIWV